jgi:hypothetical protein
VAPESIIADLHLHQLLSRLMLKAFAGLIAVFGLQMLSGHQIRSFE